jgi:uncharacterized protein YjbJ (UPF0337 family)
MNKDRIKGKAKDIAGRVERKTGEWTGDTETEVKGAAKQVEGKVQNALGQLKDKNREMREREEARRDRPVDNDIAEGDRDLDEEIAPEETPRRPKRAA